MKIAHLVVLENIFFIFNQLATFTTYLFQCVVPQKGTFQI